MQNYNNPSKVKDRKSKDALNPVQAKTARPPVTFRHNPRTLQKVFQKLILHLNQKKLTMVKIAKKDYYKIKYQLKNVDLKRP